MGAEVHPRAVPPAEEGFALLVHAGDEVFRGGDRFIVNCLHALLGERAGVLDGLAALAVGLGFQHAAGAEFFPELRVFRVVEIFRLLLCVEVVEVSQELVEPVHCGQMLVEVALVVFAKLAGGVALALEHGGHRHVGLLPAFLRAGQANLQHAVAQRAGAANEGRATGGAALLGIVIREADALLGDAVDVRRLVAHHATAIVADVLVADVVSPNNEDIGLLVRSVRRRPDDRQPEGQHGEMSCWFHDSVFFSATRQDYSRPNKEQGGLPRASFANQI